MANKIKIILIFLLAFYSPLTDVFANENSTGQYDFSMEEVAYEPRENESDSSRKTSDDSSSASAATDEDESYASKNLQIAPPEKSSFDPSVSLLKINDINTTYNRNVYKFTSYFLLEIMSPIIIVYKENVPGTVHTSLKNFFDNMDELSSAVNHILQADPLDAGVSIARFALNSTVGLLGFIDVAEMIGLNRQKTSMDDTLTSWGLPPGPFIMVPLLGGGTLRSYVGSVVDFFIDPFSWLVLEPVIPDIGGRAIFKVSKGVVHGFISLADVYVLLEDLERSSVDPYSTFRNYYLQNRHYQLMKRQDRRQMNRKQLLDNFVKKTKEDGYTQLSITDTPEKHYSEETIQTGLDFSMEEMMEDDARLQ